MVDVINPRHARLWKNRLLCGLSTGMCVSILMLTGCAQPPKKALSDAERALLAAKARKKCASESYAAAEQLLAEAKVLVDEKKYEEAKRKALAAKKLAMQAKEEADAHWEECNRRKEVIETAKAPQKDPEPRGEKPAQLSTVYFAYDSSDLSPAQRATLDQNALWMRQHIETDLLLEGHTDERGSVEYNLALGERRARIVQKYLLQLGVDQERLSILSYGEEKPSVGGQEGDRHQLNRRVDFVPKNNK